MPLEPLLVSDERACILAVDDTPAILQLLEMALGIDYEVVTVDSGARALAAVRQRKFELVMLDLLMPEMDGFETLRRLKEIPEFSGTPVIFLTAMDDLASECSALELGADDYITKPFKPNLVRLRIASILHRVRLQQQLSLALAGADQGLWSWNLATDTLHVASGWGERLSVDGAVLTTECRGWEALGHPDSSEAIRLALADYLAGSAPAFEVDARLRCQGGEWRWINIYGKAVGERSSSSRLKGSYRNVDARKTAELALAESEERLRHVMDATGEGIWDWAVQTPIVRHNAAWARMFGLGREVLERDVDFIMSLVHPDDREHVEHVLADCLSSDVPFAAEYRVRHAGGWYVWVSAHGKVVERSPEGLALRMVGALQDISEGKRVEEEYRRLALFDPLTNLPNRRLLVDRLDQAVAQNRRNGTLGALMFIDMDRFKELNDTLGHDFGDMLLIEVGRRLQSCTRKMDTVARLGGDEFIVMLPQLSAEREMALHDAHSVGEKVLASLGRPYRLGEQIYSSTPSIGLCLFSGAPEEDVEAILKHADSAMYEAKRAGRNRLCVAPLPNLPVAD